MQPNRLEVPVFPKNHHWRRGGDDHRPSAGVAYCRGSPFGGRLEPPSGVRTPRSVTIPFQWRRGGDSNPRYVLRTHAFQACSLSHSDTSPGAGNPTTPVGFRRARKLSSALERGYTRSRVDDGEEGLSLSRRPSLPRFPQHASGREGPSDRAAGQLRGPRALAGAGRPARLPLLRRRPETLGRRAGRRTGRGTRAKLSRDSPPHGRRDRPGAGRRGRGTRRDQLRPDRERGLAAPGTPRRRVSDPLRGEAHPSDLAPGQRGRSRSRSDERARFDALSASAATRTACSSSTTRPATTAGNGAP